MNSTPTGTGARDEINYAFMLEDTDIMSKIIDKTLEKKWPRKYEASTLFRQSIGCQSAYLEGYGVIFMTSINFPVAKREMPQEIEFDTDDLWQQTRSELRGVRVEKGYAKVYTGGEDFDAKRVSELKEKLLRVIGKYGARIRQLDDQESVVIVVRGAPGNSPVVSTVGYDIWRVDQEPNAIRVRQLSEEKKKQDEKLKRQEEEMKEQVNALKVELEALQEEYTDKHPQVVELQHKIQEAQKRLQSSIKSEMKITDAIGGGIIYEAKEPSDINIKIRNLDGRVVRKIESRDKGTGKYTFDWDGKNDAGKKVKSGIYTYEIKAGDDSRTGKIIITGKSGSDSEGLLDEVDVTFGGSKIIANKNKDRNIHIIEPSPAEPAEVWMKFDNPEHAAHTALAQYLSLGAAQQKGNVTGRTALIIKVSRKDIEAYKDGSLDFDDFAKQAEITQY
jgi:hypothetical protein